MSDIQFESETEKYLHENHGDLQNFYRMVANGASFKYAFAHALSKPDIYILRKGGYYSALLETSQDAIQSIGNINADVIQQALWHLEEQHAKYPEDHPIWNVR